MESLALSVPTTNKHLIRWVEKMAELCQPARIHWVDGSQAEYEELCDLLVEGGDIHQAEPEALAGAVSMRALRRTMWRAWRTALLSARCRRTMPARPTTGKTRSPCAGS